MIFGRYLGLGDESITTLGMAGMLQDVGKLRLPVRLLQKSGAASEREYEIFKTHVDFSLQILSASSQASPQMLEIVRRHHERCDGSGYPAGLKGDAVGLMAEIAGICDVYCALTRERPYGEASSSQVALDTVRVQRGVQFSESTVDQFVQCIGLYPVGTLVELNSGEVAVVVAQNRIRRLKPRVMILLGPDKQPNPYPHTLDLLYDLPTSTGTPYVIVRALPPGAYGVEPSEFYLA
jgi:HD-GYP domain-containing protein (c-di-GMP phosphodiesterase class II)